jgi:hypothetical protein
MVDLVLPVDGQPDWGELVRAALTALNNGKAETAALTALADLVALIPAGADGIDGVDGTNGTNGTNGIDGTTPPGGSILLGPLPAAVPIGTPSGTFIARLTGAPPVVVEPLVAPILVAATATHAVNLAGTSLTLSKPAAVADGDLLVAVLTHQWSVGADAWVLPSGWVVLATLTGPPGIRTTAIVGLKVPSAAAVTATTFAFSVTNSGRSVGALFRVTGADLANTVVGASAAGAETSATIFTMPAFAISVEGSLVISAYNAQFVTPNVGIPTVHSDALFTKLDERSTSADTGITRTSLALFSLRTQELSIAQSTVTWSAAAPVGGTGGHGGIAVAIRGKVA